MRGARHISCVCRCQTHPGGIEMMTIARSHAINHTRIGTRVLAGILLSAMTVGAFGAEIEPLERILETARTFLADSLSKSENKSEPAETRIEIGQLDSRLRLARCAQAPTAQLAPGARARGERRGECPLLGAGCLVDLRAISRGALHRGGGRGENALPPPGDSTRRRAS